VSARFQGKTIFITGASSGLGAEMARQFAREGARVGIVARRKVELDCLAGEIAAEGHIKPWVGVCDMVDRPSIRACYAEFEKALGVPDLVIANAGIGFPMKAESYDTERAEMMYRVNVLGALETLVLPIPGMLRRGSGQLVGISSIAGFQPFPASHTYGATKASLLFHLKGLRAELGARGIQVTALCPGFIRTPMTGQNRYPMPFILDLQPAVARMLDAIARGKGVYIFPRRLYALVCILRLAPDWLVRRVAGM
jgi:short-subunit dehydrogenase